MNHPDRQMAYHALRRVLFTLRDRLPVEEAHHLAAQLLAFMRGFYFKGYRPAGKPVKYDREEFLQHVREELQQFPWHESVKVRISSDEVVCLIR